MTAPKTTPYAICYNDGTYMTYDLTQKDYNLLADTIIAEKACAVVTSIGVIAVKDVRSIIQQKEPKPEAKPPSATPMLTTEELEWVMQNRAAWIEEAEQNGNH